MSAIELFRDRFRRLAKNQSSLASRVKPTKFDALTAKLFRDKFGSADDVSEEAIKAYPAQSIETWLQSLQSTFPVNFDPVSAGTPAARLEQANANPSQPVRKHTVNAAMKLTDKQREWLNKQSVDIRLNIEAGTMSFPRWLMTDPEPEVA